MTLNCKTDYFPVLGVNISQIVRTAVARLPLRQLGFLVFTSYGTLRVLGRCPCLWLVVRRLHVMVVLW